MNERISTPSTQPATRAVANPKRVRVDAVPADTETEREDVTRADGAEAVA